MSAPDPDPRRLLARVQALEDENADLKERLAFAFREIEYLRERAARGSGRRRPGSSRVRAWCR